MSRTGRATRPRPVTLILLAVVVIATGFAVSQCRMVSDRLTGLDVSALKASPENCIARCAVAYADSNRAESQLHVAEVRACADDSLCLALEEMRHEAAVARIQAGRQACKDDCYHEGAGGGR